ncbi:hypothetical protein [uncultured Sphingomonas sp.]|uniref:hypothetical protein n=1 Tax=uncultured Sphingomonas sp. TaxID=158754 RepID=UPI0035CB0D5F
MSDIFSDNPYIRLVEPKPFSPPPLAADEIFRGDWWSIHRRGDQLIFEFISGELAGRKKWFEISNDEADQLIDGSLDVIAFVRIREV